MPRKQFATATGELKPFDSSVGSAKCRLQLIALTTQLGLKANDELESESVSAHSGIA